MSSSRRRVTWLGNYAHAHNYAYTIFFVVAMYFSRASRSDEIVFSFIAFCPNSSLAILVKIA